MNHVDVLIIGAGAAGMMCAIEVGKRGKKAVILEKSNKPGKKIIMSGGGRCNFTNLFINPEDYLSTNKNFCKSALSRYTQWDFIALVEKYGVEYYEKKHGQLFCKEKSSCILDILLSECEKNKVAIYLNQTIHAVIKESNQFRISSNHDVFTCDSLVIATGGLSIPTLGGSPYGYQLAKQFGLAIQPTRAGLVPFTLHTHDKEKFESLAGVSVEVDVTCNRKSFHENLLFTHRGLSGPALLQISSYWIPGDPLQIQFIPNVIWIEELSMAKKTNSAVLLKTELSKWLPKRLLSILFEEELINLPINQLNDNQINQIASTLSFFYITPNATEGYRTAEVTLGGIDCKEISSKTFESYKVPGLFFIGEVLDVTGALGGFNFQWAWSSGFAAGQVA